MDEFKKENGILLLGRNSRHYFTTLSKIIPIFHPITLSNNQIPSRRSFYYSDNSDHFYDVLQKNHFASMAKVPNEISLFNSLYGNVHHGVLMNTMCSVNHLIVANRAVDVAFNAATTAASTTAATSHRPERSSAPCHTANTPVPTMALTPTTTADPSPSDRCSRLGGSDGFCSK